MFPSAPTARIGSAGALRRGTGEDAERVLAAVQRNLPEVGAPVAATGDEE